MEMVLEFSDYERVGIGQKGFNPSSNGNGAGMGQSGDQTMPLYFVSILLLMEMVLEFNIHWFSDFKLSSFNPSSNGNGAGIFIQRKMDFERCLFQSFF